MNTVFHPPVELPQHVISYVSGLQNHAAEYGAVPMNSASDLAPLQQSAQQLKPKADEINDLELRLAALREVYNREATVLWGQFSERLSYARTYADKNHKQALGDFLQAFSHHAVRHAAAQKAGAVPPAPKS